MTSFIGRLPVSVVFDTDSSRCFVSIPVAHDLSHSASAHGSRFSDILTASYDGRALTTDIEFEVARSLDCDVFFLIGMNWIAAWHAVGREDEHPAHNPYSRGASGLQGDSTSWLNLLSIVHDIFFASCRSGVRLGPLSSEVVLLEQACALHGLDFKGSYSLLELRKSLLQHLLHGECVISDTRSKHRDYTACREVAAGFGTPSNLVEFILDELMSADASVISGGDLWFIAQSICNDLECTHAQELHPRQEAISILKIFRSRSAYERVSQTFQSLFSKTEHMFKPSLEAIASWHGLCFVGTKDQLLDRIIDHVSRGKCTLYAADSRVACAHISDELCTEDVDGDDIRTHSSIDSLHSSPDTSQEVVNLQIRVLSSLRKTIACKPLIRLLRLDLMKEKVFRACANALKRI
ncbi:uncharacterized protein HD556DRAFT_1403473 [Suillus plorans]|uniref:Uncharacterized protein n=1 Tax=Suillus plorans TaxID=116603 RepID=A0A9P7DDI7_9AGAM|nr:uncharacterized protein HD556DRAFT_1403473 [Suillus plorans]KAG1788433.1 hypothetical protein HD556DRAFT_1403473 [Suillus plorans]